MELSKTQADILEVLQEDARISMRNLALRIGVSPPTASSTVKELEELGIIKGHLTMLDTRKLGLHTFHLRIGVDLHFLESVAECMVAMNGVYKMGELEGGVFFAVVKVPSLEMLDDVIKSLKKTKGVEKLEVSRVIKDFKSSSTITLDAVPGLSIDCYYCKKKIEGKPVKLELDDRKHYLCCDVCASEYEAKYRRLKDKAGTLD